MSGRDDEWKQIGSGFLPNCQLIQTERDGRERSEQKFSRSDWYKDHFPDEAWLVSELEKFPDSSGPAFAPHEGYGWYIERMLANLRQMVGCIEMNEAVLAVVHAGELATLSLECHMKFEWEGDALRGRKVADSAALTRRGSQSNRVREVDRLAAEIGRGGKRAAFALVAEREGVTAKAIEADYYKAKKKAS